MKLKFPGMNFEKEGKGVPEDGSRAGGFVRFFAILKRKFFPLVRLNLMQFIASIPAFLVAAVLSYLLLRFGEFDVDVDLSTRIFIAFVAVAFQLIAVGPLHAGFVSILRNFAREQEVFLWYDFWQGVKKNWKQALAMSVIDFVIVGLVCMMVWFYSNNALVAGTTLAQVLLVVLAVFMLLYAMMHIYIYPMIVSVDLTLNQILSNALRFAVAKFIPNLGILAAGVACSLIIFANTLAGLFLMMLVGYSLIGFLETFYAYDNIEKYVIHQS